MAIFYIPISREGKPDVVQAWEIGKSYVPEWVLSGLTYGYLAFRKDADGKDTVYIKKLNKTAKIGDFITLSIFGVGNYSLFTPDRFHQVFKKVETMEDRSRMEFIKSMNKGDVYISKRVREQRKAKKQAKKSKSVAKKQQK